MMENITLTRQQPARRQSVLFECGLPDTDSVLKRRRLPGVAFINSDACNLAFTRAGCYYLLHI